MQFHVRHEKSRNLLRRGYCANCPGRQTRDAFKHLPKSYASFQLQVTQNSTIPDHDVSTTP
jgi:hypothetical protein